MYVSPSTKSLAIAVDRGTIAAVDLNVHTRGCSDTVSGLKCTIVLGWYAVGTHTLFVAAYDALGAQGHRLSEDSALPITIVRGIANIVAISMGGLATNLSVVASPVAGPEISGSVATGFTMYGSDQSLQLTVIPIDADGNYIVGPGAPQANAISTGPLAVATLGPASANQFSVHSTFSANAPGAVQSGSVAVSVTPAPYSGGSSETVKVAFKLFDPWVYAANSYYLASRNVQPGNGNNVISAYDQQGNAKTLPATAFGNNTVLFFGPVTYDQDNGLLYAVTGSVSLTISAYDAQGDAKPLSGAFPNIQQPYDIAYDPHNKLLYVASIASNGISGSTVRAYDANGNNMTQTLSGGFPSLRHPVALAIDPSTGHIYVADVTTFARAGDRTRLRRARQFARRRLAC